MQERVGLKFPDRFKLNEWWTYTGIPADQQQLLSRLVDGGILGWSENSLRAAHIKKSNLTKLLSLRLIEITTSHQAASNTVKDDEIKSEYESLKQTGGYFNCNPEEKKFYSDFEEALKIVSENPEFHQDKRYRIKDWGFFHFLRFWKPL